jgi:hypothetical protein
MQYLHHLHPLHLLMRLIPRLKNHRLRHHNNKNQNSVFLDCGSFVVNHPIVSKHFVEEACSRKTNKNNKLTLKFRQLLRRKKMHVGETNGALTSCLRRCPRCAFIDTPTTKKCK